MDNDKQIDVLIASDTYADAVNYAKNSMGLSDEAAARLVFDRSLPIDERVRNELGPTKAKAVLAWVLVAFLTGLFWLLVLTILDKMISGPTPSGAFGAGMVGGAVGAIIGSFWLANYFYSATMRKGEMEVRKKLVAEITAAESK